MLLVDRQGVVRYRHIGEGDYDETEAAIRRLHRRRELTRVPAAAPAKGSSSAVASHARALGVVRCWT